MSLSNNPVPIALIGLMGSGKSSVAKQLAHDLNRTLIDTDNYITQTTGRKITDIFAKEGEAHFRQLEIDALQQINWSTNPIIATGGGIILKAENQKILLENCKIIYLSATKDTLINRLKNDTSRPLLSGSKKSETLKKLFDERNPLYLNLANQTIQTDTLSIKEICEIIHS